MALRDHDINFVVIVLVVVIVGFDELNTLRLNYEELNTREKKTKPRYFC